MNKIKLIAESVESSTIRTIRVPRKVCLFKIDVSRENLEAIFLFASIPRWLGMKWCIVMLADRLKTAAGLCVVMGGRPPTPFAYVLKVRQ